MPQRTDRLFRLLGIVGFAKIACGLAFGVAALGTGPDLWASRLPVLVAHVVVFGAVGSFLVVMGRDDLRATALGTVFVLVASLFADPVARVPTTEASRPELVLNGLLAVQIDAFIPFALWSFVRLFPSAAQTRLSGEALRVVLAASLYLGAVLLVANILPVLTPGTPRIDRLLAPLSRQSPTSWYWPSQYLLCLGALAYLVGKRRLGLPEDRRRTALLLWALVIGTTPMVVWSLLTSLSATADRILPLHRAGWVIYPSLLAVPVGVAYAVVARQALELRWIVRQVIQYALARYSVIALAGAPIGVLLVLMFQRRDQPIGTGLFTPGVLGLGLCALAGLVVLQGRQGLLERIDRRFFREMYDARRTLSLLVDQCRWVSDGVELAAAVRSEITRALHPQATWLMLLQESQPSFASPADGVSPLPADAALVKALQQSEEFLDCNLESPIGASALPLADRHWLVEARARYLVPLRDGRQRLIGMLTLGEKENGLPYARDDWALLTAVAAAVEMSIAYHGLRPWERARQPSAGQPEEPRARECESCGLIQQAPGSSCVRCSQFVTEGPLPRSIGGKYLLEERIGRGGMGVVYRAVDLELDRVIALKTLPYVSPEEALRLRREARLMAAVSHPHLAQIHGVETWRGHPFLVVEILAGGTLTSRLSAGPLALGDTVELGRAIGGAIEAIHAAGVLHRDIKPSNIGYTQAGTAKLLDFGLARLTQSQVVLRIESLEPTLSAGGAVPPEASPTTSTIGHGTPLYMSPEALRGAAPEPTFDLWSLSVVLYEAAAGVNPFAHPDPARARDRILHAEVPDIRSFLPGAPVQLAAFFRRALSANPIERPRSARALVAQLAALPALAHSTASGRIAQSA